MSKRVKPRTPRRYDSSRRQEQARENRVAVLDAARLRFLDQGYAGTPLIQVAGDAGVSVQTVYKAFTSKAGLLKALFDVSVAGDDEPIPMSERDTIRDIAAEPDPTKKINMYAEHLAATMPRSAPVQLLARDAAAADPDAADVWAQIRQETLTAMTAFARNLADTRRLRVTINQARDILWTYHAPEIYDLLVLERGWSTKRYGHFLAAALVTALVETH
jgi:AcrR family transcriptional regulator